MSRVSFLLRHPGRALSGLSIITAAAGLTVGSGANFSATAANAATVFTTGNLTLSDTAQTDGAGAFVDSAVILTAANMKPGDISTGLVAIQNTGSLAGALNLAAADVSTNSLAGDLSLRIINCGQWTTPTVAPTTCAGTVSVYKGTLAGASLTPIPRLAAGEGHLYKFIVSLPTSAGNADQSSAANATFDWTATTT